MIGWLAVVLGGVISIVNISTGNSGKFFIFIGIVLLGLVLIITGQITRAVVNNTDANSQMLEILKFKENVKINWISENKSYGPITGNLWGPDEQVLNLNPGEKIMRLLSRTIKPIL